MSSVPWRVLGPGSVLPRVLADIGKANREVVIVGPFIDHYFAGRVVEACPTNVSLRVLCRPYEAVSPDFAPQARAAVGCFLDRGAEVRSIAGLHAKVVLIDDASFFCGSANWYRYSLEESLEIVVNGPVEILPALCDEVASLWDESEPLERSAHPEQTGVRSTADGQPQEVLDPIAAAKMAEVRGAFVVGAKKPGR